jgi:hypothetical protein
VKTNEIAQIGDIRIRALADGGVLFALPDGRTHGSIPPARRRPGHTAAFEAWVQLCIAQENYCSNEASLQFAFHARTK